MAGNELNSLDALAAALESLRRTAGAYLRELTDEQLVWKPGAERWSVAQCFEHLRRFDSAYAGRIADALDRSRPATTDGHYRPSLVGRLFAWGSAPGTRIKMPAPPRMRPPASPPNEARGSIERFLEQQAMVLALIHRARAYDVNAIRFASPLSRLFRLTVGDGFAVIVNHEMRHFAQAERVTEEPGFPKGSPDSTRPD